MAICCKIVSNAMKTKKKKLSEDSAIGSSSGTLDPFAVDFFGEKDSTDLDSKQKESKNGNGPVKGAKGLKLDEIKGLDWHRLLPKMSKREAEFSNRLTSVPTGLSESSHESVKKAFSRFTQLDEDAIHCEILSVSEVNLADAAKYLKRTPQIFLTLHSEPNSEGAVVAINAEFASALIDLVLGGKGKSPENLRPLSPIEQTIIEFLAINVFGELNSNLDKTRFRLESVENKIETDFDPEERGAELVLDFIFGKLSGSVTLLLPIDFIDSLNVTDKAIFRQKIPADRFDEFRKISRKLSLGLDIGRTKINANDLAFLEKDDVILVEEAKNLYQESVSVFFGGGTNCFFSGRIQQSEEPDSKDTLSQEILLEVEEISSEKFIDKKIATEKMSTQQTEEKIEATDAKNNEESGPEDQPTDEAVSEDLEQTSEDIEEEIDEQTIETLENVMVNLRVSLGGKRLSLDDLRNIRVGQIVELGCRPNDPVDILTDSDNKPIARGELLEVEGQLGVRLTKIYV